MPRKQFTTTISEKIQKDFKKACSDNDTKMNDVLETFMTAYINGEFNITTKKSYKLEKKDK